MSALFFSRLKNFIVPSLVIALIALVFFNLRTCDQLKIERQARERDQKIFNQNFDALFDTITKTYNKQLEANEFTKSIFLTKMDELAKYDSNLYGLVSKMKGDIISAIDSKVSVNIPSTEVGNEVETYGDDNYGLRWEHKYSDPGFSQYLSGASKFKLVNNHITPGKTIIDSNTVNINISYGFKEENDKYKVWAISKSPIVKLNELSGAQFIDKPPPFESIETYKKPWVIGPYIGYGVNFDSKFSDSRFGWSVGVSFQYNLFNFGKIKPKKEESKTIEIDPSSIIGQIPYDTIFEHIVQKDQTLYTISAKYNTSVDKIIAFNDLENTGIYVNQKLLIPVKK
jgi:hypothetical protein